ncbi:MAG: Gfo/Idh/MocA family oxidoreductase [Eubacterium sp.]|nr:Gfo/Idh/MocA family oxidoreductase [Eubacterium sp.]
MKVAVLGTGFGAYHAQLYAKMPDIDSVAVWGRNKEKLQELQDKFQVEITTEMDTVWQDDNIALVDICLPNHLHKEMALKALHAGKHVFIETPVTESLADAEGILHAAGQCGRRVFADLFLRFEYPYQYLYQAIKENTYGRLKELQVKRESPPWWGNLDSTHIGLNFMIHDLDFVTRCMGEAENLSVNRIDVRKEQSLVTACLQYKDAAAYVRGASAMPRAYPFSVGYEAVLEHAVIRYYEDGYADGRTETKLELFLDDEKMEIPLPQSDCYQSAIEHVVQCLKDGKPSCLSIEEAIRTLRAVLSMNQML